MSSDYTAKFLPNCFSDTRIGFKNPLMVGWSLALTVGLASLTSATLFYATWRPYRTHYAQMHAAR
jgi:hypothetical protein